MSNKPKVIDLFSGCGGLALGFSQAGYKVSLGIDDWQDSLDTFKSNIPGSAVLNTDLSNFDPLNLPNKYKGIDVLIGGPPCQGFSISGKRNIEDPRNKLYKSFLIFLVKLKPKAFVLENVPFLLSMSDGKVKEKILSDFLKAGYRVNHKILLASNFGIPQNRRRVFFVGLRDDQMFVFPKETHGNVKDLFVNSFITTKDAINDLPENGVDDGSLYVREAENEYQKEMRVSSSGIFNHWPVEHKQKTQSIISLVPDGGNYKNLPIDLQTIRKVNIAWTRMSSKKPSFTIDTGHNHHFHYKFNRVPTARESARIQSFPDTFVFHGRPISQLRQIGNAVPPKIAKILAKELLNYI